MGEASENPLIIAEALVEPERPQVPVARLTLRRNIVSRAAGTGGR